MPPPIKRGRESGAAPEFPYSSMYLKALTLGFTTKDLHCMDYPTLLWFLRAAMPPEQQKRKARKATQADINNLFA